MSNSLLAGVARASHGYPRSENEIKHCLKNGYVSLFISSRCRFVFILSIRRNALKRRQLKMALSQICLQGLNGFQPPLEWSMLQPRIRLGLWEMPTTRRHTEGVSDTRKNRRKAHRRLGERASMPSLLASLYICTRNTTVTYAAWKAIWILN